MRKHLFDRSLYLDALRQLKFIGVAGTLLLSLEAVLIPIGYLVQSSQRHGYTGIIALDAMDMHPLLILCFLILAPIMVLYLFQFLNKRPIVQHPGGQPVCGRHLRRRHVRDRHVVY